MANSSRCIWVGGSEVKQVDGMPGFFCDEIGPLEVLEGKGWVKALDIVDARKFDLYILSFRPSLQEFFRKRYPEMTIYDLESTGVEEKVICDVKSLFNLD